MKRPRREGQDVWSKGVVVNREEGGVEKCCCCCLLEKSSGGFVLYLVPLGGFEEGRLPLIFAWCRRPVFHFRLAALPTSTFLTLHVRGVA